MNICGPIFMSRLFKFAIPCGARLEFSICRIEGEGPASGSRDVREVE